MGIVDNQDLLVNLVQRVHLDQLVDQVCLELQEFLVHMVHKEDKVYVVYLVQWAKLAILEQLDQKVLEVTEDHVENRDHQVHLGHLVKKVNVGKLENVVQWVQKVVLVPRVLQAHLGNQVIPDLLENLDILVHQDLRENAELLDKWVHLVLLEELGKKELQVLLDVTGLKVKEEKKVTWETVEHKVFLGLWEVQVFVEKGVKKETEDLQGLGESQAL